MTGEEIFIAIYLGAHVVALITFLALAWKTHKHNDEMRRKGLYHYVIGPF